MKTIRYGTRGSKLALAQSAMVARALAEATGATVERVVITTSGDMFSLQGDGPTQPPDAPDLPSPRPSPETRERELMKTEAPNVKAMFVKEIEEALLDGRIDFAVHSAKDLPAALPPGLILAAVPPREDPRDAFLPAPRSSTFGKLKQGGLIATGSLRRRIQLALARPDALFAPIRGNVDTRLGRLDRGEFDGMILAMAGLRRLGLNSRRHEALPESVVVPAPGQGTLAIEAREDRADVLDLLRVLEDAPTRLELEAERAFLAAVGGGCETPLGCLARVAGPRIAVTAFWSEADGSKPRRLAEQGEAESGREIAERMAARMLAGAANG